MSREIKAYRAAARRSEAARAQFLEDLGAVKTSVSPRRLKAQIRTSAEERAQLAAMAAKRGLRRHGWTIGGVVAALVAWRFRRPLAALSGRLWVNAQTLWRRYQERRQDDDR